MNDTLFIRFSAHAELLVNFVIKSYSALQIILNVAIIIITIN